MKESTLNVFKKVGFVLAAILLSLLIYYIERDNFVFYILFASIIILVLAENSNNSKYTWLLVFLIAVPFFNDGYLEFQLMQDWMMDNAKIASFVVLCILMIMKKRSPSKLWFSLLAMQIWWFIATMLNYPLSDSETFHKLFMDILNILSLGLIIEVFKDKTEALMSGLMLNFELCIYPEIISIIYEFPSYMYYILGYYSLTILWMLPAIVVSTLYIIKTKKYLRASLLIAGSVVLIFMLSCATITVAFMGMAFVLILAYVMSKIDKLKNIKIPAWLLLLIALFGNIFVLFIYTGGKMPLIDFFIEKALHRDTTFTSRTIIWENAMNMIKESPIIGHGFRPEVLGFDDRIYIHAHNQILQQLNSCGVIGLLFFLFFHFVLVFKIDKNKNSFPRTFTLAACFAVWITYLTEAYKKSFRLYLVFFIAYHIDDIIVNKISQKEKLNNL